MFFVGLVYVDVYIRVVVDWYEVFFGSGVWWGDVECGVYCDVVCCCYMLLFCGVGGFWGE